MNTERIHYMLAKTALFLRSLSPLNAQISFTNDYTLVYHTCEITNKSRRFSDEVFYTP